MTLTLHAADALEYVPQVRVAREDEESGVGSLVGGPVEELHNERLGGEDVELHVSFHSMADSVICAPDSPTTRQRTPRSERRRPWPPPPPPLLLLLHALIELAPRGACHPIRVRDKS